MNTRSFQSLLTKGKGLFSLKMNQIETSQTYFQWRGPAVSLMHFDQLWLTTPAGHGVTDTLFSSLYSIHCILTNVDSIVVLLPHIKRIYFGVFSYGGSPLHGLANLNSTPLLDRKSNIITKLLHQITSSWLRIWYLGPSPIHWRLRTLFCGSYILNQV